MDINKAIAAFAALSHPGRIAILRLLVAAGPDGIPAGRIGKQLGQKQNTTSVNLSVLDRAGLVSGVRDGRHVIYRANFEAIGGLVGFLLEDCCGGRTEACTPVAAILAQASSPRPDQCVE
jgi:DNA-binding transcriptional ArsR family regulator